MLALVGLTSVGGYLIGLMWFRLSGKALRPALGKMLECVGATLLFAVLNVALRHPQRAAAQANGQRSTVSASVGCRMRGRGDSTNSRIETAIPAHPMAMPPRTPIQPASVAARSAPSG